MRILKLKQEEQNFLEIYVKSGKKSARSLNRARILLFLHRGDSAQVISEKLGINRDTVYNIKKRFLDEGLKSSLNEKPRSGQPIKYNKKKKAEIIATACTGPPEGYSRWSVRLLVKELKTKDGFESINRESVRLVLKKATPNLG